MNLIVTGRDNSSTEVDELRKRSCVVDPMPTERLLDLLKQDLYPLLADAIVSFVDIGTSELASPPNLSPETTAGERFVQEVRRLPDSCAMLDGRKWRAIPIVIVLSGTEAALSRERIGILASTEAVVFLEAEQDFKLTFRAIENAVREYRQRLLAEFSDLGYLVYCI